MSENLPDPVKQNLERLLSEAYQPENISEDFAQRTLARLERIASERRRKLHDPDPTPWKRIAWLYFANAVAIVLLIVLPSLFWHFFLELEQNQKDKPKDKPRSTDRAHPPSKMTPSLKTTSTSSL